MMRESDRLDLHVETLLERGRTIRPVSDVVRARALARARRHIATADATAPVLGVPRRGRGPRFALAASLALSLGAAGAAAALHGRIARPSQPAAAPTLVGPPPVPAPVQRTTAAAADAEAASAAQPGAPEKKRAGAGRSTIGRESYAAELELLHRAQVAQARGNFSATLSLVGEHSRRFPNGRLSEEREALRVQSLVGAGRKDDARRAVAVFRRRFPRSVFLPHLQETVGGVE